MAAGDYLTRVDGIEVLKEAVESSLGAASAGSLVRLNNDGLLDPSLGVGNGVSGSYEATFTQADLSIAHLLPIAHGLPTSPSAITIYDDSGGVIEPDFWRSVAANQIEVGLESFAPIVGLWRVSVAN